MGEMKHTPGPWQWEFKKGETSEGTVSLGSNDSLIAIVAGENYGLWRDAEDNGESEFEANTRIISAAPELLEALQLHVAYEATPMDRGGSQGPKGKAWKAFVEARDKAVAKATGK